MISTLWQFKGQIASKISLPPRKFNLLLLGRPLPGEDEERQFPACRSEYWPCQYYCFILCLDTRSLPLHAIVTQQCPSPAPRRAGPQADGGQLPPAPPQRSPRAGQRPSPKRYLYRHHTAARGLRRTLKIEVRSRLIEPRRAAAAAATQPALRRAAAAVAFKAGPRAAAAQKRRSGRGLPDL